MRDFIRHSAAPQRCPPTAAGTAAPNLASDAHLRRSGITGVPEGPSASIAAMAEVLGARRAARTVGLLQEARLGLTRTQPCH